MADMACLSCSPPADAWIFIGVFSPKGLPHPGQVFQRPQYTGNALVVLRARLEAVWQVLGAGRTL